jgi:hypothetical protein
MWDSFYLDPMQSMWNLIFPIKMPEYKVQLPTNRALTKDTQHHLSVSKSSSDNYSINGRWFRDNCKPPPGMTNIGWLRNWEAYLKARVWEDELSGDKSPAAYLLAHSGHGHTKNSQTRALAISHNKTHSSNKALFLLLSWQFMRWQCTRSIGVHDLSAMSTASKSTGHSIHSSQWEG